MPYIPEEPVEKQAAKPSRHASSDSFDDDEFEGTSTTSIEFQPEETQTTVADCTPTPSKEASHLKFELQTFYTPFGGYFSTLERSKRSSSACFCISNFWPLNLSKTDQLLVKFSLNFFKF